MFDAECLQTYLWAGAHGLQRLVCQPRVLRDQELGLGQNFRARAIVLSEHDHAVASEVATEKIYVARVCPAPREDRLVIIGNYKEVAVLAYQLLDYLVLHSICILEFVDKDRVKALPVPIQNRRVFKEEPLGEEED